MKKNILLVIIFAICIIMCTSCKKDKETQGNAAAFVGTYSVSTVEYATWGNSSATLTDTGELKISMISGNRVSTSGYFNTNGTVVGNCLYLESEYSSDSYGHLTTVFGTGTLNGNVITLSTTTSGQLKYEGVMYPFYATSDHTCIKQ